MAYTSEIEKLEKRWAENPKGRNFAPLADAYRKAGELDRALELCTAGLALHPDYVSAHIVYARCLIDQKNDAGASGVFQKVLTLDPENVLALKMLAEIAERGGHPSEAVDWLTRLLNADPMNGDAAEALARAKAKAAQAAGKSEPVVRMVPETIETARAPSPPPPSPPSPPASVAAQPDFVIEHLSEGPPPPTLAPKGSPSDIETFDGTIDFNAVAHDAARADGLEVQEEVELTPQDMVVEGLAQTQYESGLSGDELPTVELPLIMPDDVEEPHAAAPPPAPTGAARRTPAPQPPPPSPPPPPPPPPLRPLPQTPAAPPAAVALSDDDGAADTAALSRAEPVLTETMAELYLRQGHQDDALRVYQALLEQRPGDARLRARIASLTGRGSGGEGRGRGGVREGGAETGETVHAFLKRILAGRPGGTGAASGGTSAPPASQSVDPPPPPNSGSLEGAFAVASEFEPDAGGGEGGAGHGEATRPADDNISLDQVFGDEGARSSLPPLPPPPPSPPPSPPSPAAGPPSGGFSFDQFFSAGAEPAPSTDKGAGSAERADAPKTTGARGSGPRARPAGEDEGDLDQFQAWLRGLKS